MSASGGKQLMLVRLRHVATVDFRKNETTNYRELPADVRGALREGEAVCFKSHGGDQVVFVLKPRSVMGPSGTAAEVVASLRLRLPKTRTWHPLMMQEYARDVGLELDGWKRLSEHLSLKPDDVVEDAEPAKPAAPSTRAPRRIFVQVKKRGQKS